MHTHGLEVVGSQGGGAKKTTSQLHLGRAVGGTNEEEREIDRSPGTLVKKKYAGLLREPAQEETMFLR